MFKAIKERQKLVRFPTQNGQLNMFWLLVIKTKAQTCHTKITKPILNYS